jgi:Ni2+-binding GTPase involved in maturation of urease and hydrogenase
VKLGDQMTKDLSTLKDSASYEDERASSVVVINKRNLISYVQKNTTSSAPVTQNNDSYDPFSTLYAIG